jgi:aspartyl-tRNA(Asn)/glutamyl-tRNA(Gln) amidotransferase subunit B
MADVRYAPVIGVEVHVQLRTAGKMFCGCRVDFAAPPNTLVCPVCLGLPGAMPALNARAVEQGVRAAVGLGCTVNGRSAFVRKHYTYPDLPKGYQITQDDRPLAVDGGFDVPAADGSARRVRIARVHLEEDSGRLLHDRVAGSTAVDFNRAGTPLLEIVSEPDIASPAEAREFLLRLRAALEYLGVSDCSMEEGSLRVDANVSLRADGGAPGARTEIKNLNSFRGVERALAFEVARQEAVLRAGGTVAAETRLWDAARGEARVLRGKEDPAGYRFLPEPDLPPLRVDDATVERIRETLPTPPVERASEMSARHGVTGEQARTLASSRPLADYFEDTVRMGAEPGEAAAWVLGDVRAAMRAAGLAPERFPVRPADLAALLAMRAEGTLTRPGARQAFARMAATGATAPQVVAELGLFRAGGAGEVDAWIDEALRAHPAEGARYLGGETKLEAFFVGEVLRASRGTADPGEVTGALRARTEG